MMASALRRACQLAGQQVQHTRLPHRGAVLEAVQKISSGRAVSGHLQAAASQVSTFSARTVSSRRTEYPWTSCVHHVRPWLEGYGGVAARSRLAAESGFARMSTLRPASAAGERPPLTLAPLNMAAIPPLQACASSHHVSCCPWPHPDDALSACLVASETMAVLSAVPAHSKQCRWHCRESHLTV